MRLFWVIVALSLQYCLGRKQGRNPPIEPPTEDPEPEHWEDILGKDEGELNAKVKAEGSGSVTMNIYGGPSATEQVGGEAGKEEIDKIAGTVGRLESEEGQSNKHESDVEEMDAKHADNEANMATSKILNILDEETADLQNEEKKAQDVLGQEEAKTDVTMRALEEEEKADESKEKSAENALKRHAHEVEKDMKEEEGLIKEDEHELKEVALEAEHELTDIAEDEKAELKKIENIEGKGKKEQLEEETPLGLTKPTDKVPLPACEERKTEGSFACGAACGHMEAKNPTSQAELFTIKSKPFKSETIRRHEVKTHLPAYKSRQQLRFKRKTQDFTTRMRSKREDRLQLLH